MMDQELAKRLFAEGAVLVLLDVPERTEFGIDYNCWNVGPKFKGVKMIPPGLHFIYYWYTAVYTMVELDCVCRVGAWYSLTVL